MHLTTNSDGHQTGFALLKRCDVKLSKNGDTYLDIILADKDGEMPSKIWNYNDHSQFEPGMLVKITGNVEQYQGKDQFKMSKMRPVRNTDTYNLEDLVPSSKISGKVIFDKLIKIVSSFHDSDLKAIVTHIMKKKHDLLVVCPAAAQLHHAILGGLMLHTWAIVQMAERVCQVYPNVDRELLLSGAILHDVAKTWEFELSETGLVKNYSVEGQLIGHLAKGAVYIDRAAIELHIRNRKVALLQHMLLSHHGTPEYGAAVRPMFIEADILYMLDTLDAHIYEMNDALNKVAPGECTDRQWMLDNRRLFNTGRTKTEYDVTF